LNFLFQLIFERRPKESRWQDNKQRAKRAESREQKEQTSESRQQVDGRQTAGRSQQTTDSKQTAQIANIAIKLASDQVGSKQISCKLELDSTRQPADSKQTASRHQTEAADIIQSQ
jgi:hypothetical protein